MFAEFKHQVLQCVETALSASRLTYASIGVSLVFLFLLFKIMFRAPGSFSEDLANTQKPWLRDSLWDYVLDTNAMDRRWSKLKIFLWLGLSAAGGWAAHHKLPELFPNFFR